MLKDYIHNRQLVNAASIKVLIDISFSLLPLHHLMLLVTNFQKYSFHGTPLTCFSTYISGCSSFCLCGLYFVYLFHKSKNPQGSTLSSLVLSLYFFLGNPLQYLHLCMIWSTLLFPTQISLLSSRFLSPMIYGIFLHRSLQAHHMK